ncbi:---NA---, partial [Olea europaea subsp. europaea]
MSQDAYTSIRMLNPKTINELEQMIKSWQDVQDKSRKISNDRQSKNCQNKQALGSLSQDIKDQANKPKEFWCLNCGQKGHGTRSCPKPYDADKCRKQKEEWSKKPPQNNESSSDNEEVRYIQVKECPPE